MGAGIALEFPGFKAIPRTPRHNHTSGLPPDIRPSVVAVIARPPKGGLDCVFGRWMAVTVIRWCFLWIPHQRFPMPRLIELKPQQQMPPSANLSVRLLRPLCPVP